MASNICKLCDQQDWENSSFNQLASDIMSGKPGEAILHRKLWEFTKTVEALQNTGNWNSSARGLSVAAGSERLLFYLANNIERIVATDVYGQGRFVNNEAKDEFLDNPSAFAPYPFRQENLKAMYMDALNLRFEDDVFDFAFCLSSMEHFGGVQAAARSIREMLRVVKPGGTVSATTDVSLNGLISHDVFRKEEIEELVEAVGLPLHSPIEWHVSEESQQHLLDMRKDNLDVLPHINLKAHGAVFTSINLVWQKPKAKFEDKYQDLKDFDHYIEEVKNSLQPEHIVDTSQSAISWTLKKLKSLKFILAEKFG